MGIFATEPPYQHQLVGFNGRTAGFFVLPHLPDGTATCYLYLGNILWVTMGLQRYFTWSVS